MIIIDSDKLPFHNELEKKAADKAIVDFIDVIESEKKKSEEFSKKVEEIDFNLLFLQSNKNDWKQWKERYSFTDSQLDLVNEAVLDKKFKYQKQLGQVILSYCAIHTLSKIVAYKNKMPYNHKHLMPFRFGKYVVLGGFLYGYDWTSKWYL